MYPVAFRVRDRSPAGYAGKEQRRVRELSPEAPPGPLAYKYKVFALWHDFGFDMCDDVSLKEGRSGV